MEIWLMRKDLYGSYKHPFTKQKKRGLIFALVQNMVGSSLKSCRQLSKELGVHHITVWRWRMAVTEVLARYKKQGFEGIIEADETFFKSHKGSREWVNYYCGRGEEPPCLQWHRCRYGGIHMLRDLSR